VIEILILIGLGKRIGSIVRAKGHSAGGYQALLVVLWFVGEIGGGFMGATLAAIATEHDDASLALTYLFALLGAIMGAVIAFTTAKSLSPVENEKYGSRQFPSVVPALADEPQRTVDDRFKA
jgi:hypothetical protein